MVTPPLSYKYNNSPAKDQCSMIGLLFLRMINVAFGELNNSGSTVFTGTPQPKNLLVAGISISENLTKIKKLRQGHFLDCVNPAFASFPESGEGDEAPSPGRRLRRGSAKQS